LGVKRINIITIKEDNLEDSIKEVDIKVEINK
jgi:hypothetical protein